MYKFNKSVHNILKLDMDNIKYQHPTAFIHMLTEDEAVSVVYYNRYHDFINSNNKFSENFDEIMSMYNIFWDLNKQHLLSSEKEYESILRKNKSISEALIKYFKYDRFIAPLPIKTLIYKELSIELFHRIEWEESKILGVIKSVRSGNNINKEFIERWSTKYADHEDKSRSKWYNFLIKITKDTINEIIEFVDKETADEIKNININDLVLPLISYEIYQEDRYDYLFNFDLNKIKLVDGLWKIVENGEVVMTSKYGVEYNKAVSFKDVVIVPTPIKISTHNQNKPYVNKSNTKKNYPKRKQQMESLFGPDVPVDILNSEGKVTIPNIILNEYAKCEDSKSKRSISRDNKRNEYLKNTKGGAYACIQPKNNFDRKIIRENNTSEYMKKESVLVSNKVTDIDMEERKNYEQINDGLLYEYSKNFVFSSFSQNNRKFIHKKCLKIITGLYNLCEKRRMMIDEYIVNTYNKIVSYDVKNKTNNLGLMFNKYRMNSNIYMPSMYDL